MKPIGESMRQLVPEFRGEDPPTFRCGDCRDTAVVSRDCGGSHRSRLRSGTRIRCQGCAVAWFCQCKAGESAEAGHWYERIYPSRDGRRQKSDHGEAEFVDYLRAYPSRNFIMRSRVEDLKRKYESARSRKLQELSEEQ